MKYTITILEQNFEQLRNITFSEPGLEGAAYLLCKESRSNKEIRLLGREVIPVLDRQYLERKEDYLSIASESYVKVAKLAKQQKLSIIFVHSHPKGLLEYSGQDNREEPKLQEFFASRAPENIHGSLILTETGVIGRVFVNRTFQNMELVRVIGGRYSFYFHDAIYSSSFDEFDRQILAFGKKTQHLLSKLHIGIVGAGGTGSITIEQLARLGVGEISVFDGDTFDLSNINRLYGSNKSHINRKKTLIAKDHLRNIGLNTSFNEYSFNIDDEVIAKKLRNCDIIFGCTDSQISRSILTKISLHYLIPVFDLGVLVDSHDSKIRDVIGRVTILFPGEACLFCRGRITPEGLRVEGLSQEERKGLEKEGYVPELGTPAPAVIPFTTAISSFAVSELLHKLTGYMGANRMSSELLCFFDKSSLKTNRVKSNEDCFCSNRDNWGIGDSTPFLGQTWKN